MQAEFEMPGNASPRLRPLLSLDHAKAWLDLDERAVLARIEDGRLGLAFDLRVASSARRYVRIYAPCVLALLAGRPQPCDLDLACRDILGRFPGPRLRGSALCSCFNVSSEHILRLVGSGAFRVERPVGRGCYGTPLLSRPSVETFLRERRIA